MAPSEDDALLEAQKAQYDQSAKKFVAQRHLLAHILQRVVPEFQHASIRQIADECITGEPEIASVHVNPDQTNLGRQQRQDSKPRSIAGDRNESNSPTEGKVDFDILFHARVPHTGERLTLIINVEIQKDDPSHYHLIKRAVYYACRLISSQKEYEFHGQDYNGIHKVYTIWLCMEPPTGEGSSITSYALTEKHLHGHHREILAYYDLINITLVYIGNRRTQDNLLELLRLIFKENADAATKKKQLQQKYGLNLLDDAAEELSTMCNLGEGVYERGFAHGEARGEARGEVRGTEKTWVESVRNLMQSMKLTAQQAIEILSVPTELRPKVLKQL